MPLHTPSPRRFLAPAASSAQKPKPKTKPQSGLRHVATSKTSQSAAFHSQQTFPEVDDQRRVTSARRFIIPPRSSHTTPNSGEDRKSGDQIDHESTPTQSRPRPKLPKLSKAESIDITSSPSSSANTQDQNGDSFVPSVELPPTFAQVDEDEEEEIVFVRKECNKRRRVSPHSLTDARSDPPTLQELSSPQMPSPVSHRFRIPANRPQVFDNVSTPATDRAQNSRPHFILPHLSPSATKSATSPLPETFSPSRKNGKYVQDGMASTLQSWIHETASTGYTASTNSAVVWGRDKEDGVKMKVRVLGAIGSWGGDETGSECWPGGVTFVRGTTDSFLYNASKAPSLVHAEADAREPAEIKIMLVGQGGARGKAGMRIRLGGFVGVRAPVWDVQVGGAEQAEKWLVGVEWVLL